MASVSQLLIYSRNKNRQEALGFPSVISILISRCTDYSKDFFPQNVVSAIPLAAYKTQFPPGISSFVEELRHLCGFAASRLSTDDHNGILINGFHDHLLFSKDWEL